MRLHFRQPTPHEQEILSRQPECDEAMTLCISAWHELGTCRPVGMSGAGAIPFTATLQWAQFRGLDRELTEILLTVINKLDCERAEREASQRSLQ